MVYQRALPITSCHQPPIFPPPMVLQLLITFPRKIFPCTKLLSIKPPPPVSAIEAVLELSDLVLVMSVEPGYSGQDFMPEVLPKVRALSSLLAERQPDALIEIDGGIDAETLPLALEAGAQVFVASSAIFKHSEGIAAGLQALRRASLASEQR